MEDENPSLAAVELVRRRRARVSLIEYSQYITIPGAPVSDDADEWIKPVESRVAQHHRLLMTELQRTMETPGGRLMVFMPPGSAKSTYTTVVAPTWAMGCKPGTQIILGSYATDLARKHGKRARQIVSSKEFMSLFGTGLSAGSSAANEWALTNGSEYMSAGLQAGLTGNRADGLIIDDPVAGRQEAESEANRQSTWDAYNDDARTRLKPNGWRAIVQTRWHEQDLAGMILPENWAGESGAIACRDGHVWRVICLPAEADREDDPLGRKLGEGLWPEWFGKGHWDEFKFPPRSWLSLYQQKPTSDQGTFFKREWLDKARYETKPERLSIYLSGDFAVTEGDGDFTEIAVWGVDEHEHIYALDWWSGQSSADAWINIILSYVQTYEPLFFIGETGPIRRAVEPFLMKEMLNRRIHVACEWLSHASATKEANARSFQALCSVGKVHFPRMAWAERCIDQLLKFPNGAHDDAVDACSLFGRFVAKTWGADPVPVKKVVDWSPSLVIRDFE